MAETHSIKVGEDTYQLLISRMLVRETFDQLIRRLLEATAKRRRTRKQANKTEGGAQ